PSTTRSSASATSCGRCRIPSGGISAWSADPSPPARFRRSSRHRHSATTPTRSSPISAIAPRKSPPCEATASSEKRLKGSGGISCESRSRSLSAWRSERLENGLRARHLEGAGLLDIERLDDAIVDDHRITLRADAEAIGARIELEADRLGEIGIAVGEHLHLAVGLLVLAPGVHDEGVIDREAGDGV